MLGVQYHQKGNLAKFHGILERAEPAQLQAQVFGPFMGWITRIRIPRMYLLKGRVSGADGQPAWAALSKWTIAAKGTGKVSGVSALSPMVTNAMRMARSYVVNATSQGSGNWRFILENKSRSTSRWSPGFDYPSALHTGWMPYDVKPRPDGPGFLVIPMMKGTVIKGSMGRKGTGAGLGKTIAGDRMIAMKTRPNGAPARPHIKFFRIDVIALGKMTLAYVFRNQAPSEGTAE